LQFSGNTRRKRYFAFLLSFGLLTLSMAVFGWGLQYKLSLYQGRSSVAHLTPEAKLLSQKERPLLGQTAAEHPACRTTGLSRFSGFADGDPGCRFVPGSYTLHSDR
jgi:hypothetical protein